MGLAQTRVSHKDEVFSAIHVAPLGQFQNRRFGNILHRRKVVVGEFLEERESRSPDGHLNPLGISIRHLCLTESQQKLLRREAIACGVSRIGLVQFEKRWEAKGTKI